MRLLLDAINDDHRLAEVGLGMPRRMGQRHEHLATTPVMLANVILHDRVAAGEAVFLPQPFEHTLGGVPLLARDTAILFEPGVDDLGKTIQLRALDRRLAAVAWRN
ncbi:hypothetical protein DT23_18705 [Thioclava indica]|uniref:Uncharacterized protein n=1 Tax=Thioclava indica TaxID=1353528 RepID=A0A074J928_9RHOB|nr:hypothetical protein DT23_18705 [Thioclava indica]